MARMASSDGITTIACTPHILPGVYNNTGPTIRAAVARLQENIFGAGIPITLVTGADVHVAPDLTVQLREGRALTLKDSRYFLLEPPHHLLPPRLEDLIFGLQAAGYVPILTHPERLSWIEGHYGLMERFACNSVLMQITAGSLMGQFGRRPRYWAERMLDDGFVICWRRTLIIQSDVLHAWLKRANLLPRGSGTPRLRILYRRGLSAFSITSLRLSFPARRKRHRERSRMRSLRTGAIF
jgi:protein-tyrosine phosphatase